MGNKLRDQEIKLLRDAIKTHSPESPLLNSKIMKNSQGDDPYLNAEELYNAFIELEDRILGDIHYSQSMILELMQEWLGDRYKTFYREYHSKYPKPPLMKVKKYLKNFTEYMNTEIKLRGFERYKKGIDADYLKKVDKGLKVAINYFRAIDEQELAQEIWKHYTKPLEKPLTKRSFKSEQIGIYAPRMVERCGIPIEEARKHLKKQLDKILL